ncbi:LysR family transcriptional regulator [Metabacillus idriensis]|uniref:LysR family transcriptional regulator n=1 Tax=Metabacillus idriensis TaxID=324768 RepID=UPI002813DE13|nr:LysR family transcriptional regulator [Metabacillus idriensis]MDR0139532.1 LysR family transcriptional regulator [Metabacillus idriensis]
MEFTWLQTFVTAAECENFRRTAEILYISQPSVSVHIKLLEKELGVGLFERDGRKIRLTEEGRVYLKHAKELLAVYQNGLVNLQSFQQGFTSQFTLAISPLIADTILPYVLKKYCNQYPQVEISVKIIESSEIEEAVRNDKVDLGLSCLGGTHPDINCQLLYKDKVLLVAPHDGMDSERALPMDEEEVLTSNYLLTHNHPVYWDSLCRAVKANYPGIRMMEVSQIHITKRFIVEGLGVSFLPASTVRREMLEGRLLEVDCPSIPLPEAHTYAIMKYTHKKQKEFLAFLSQFRI